ncbi:hypothetical protein GCM10023107_48420 [Actinoplanes octamycinicus]|nr:hypothetical protein Aoc01nite_01950 [Actinoplanes octamycinicus]
MAATADRKVPATESGVQAGSSAALGPSRKATTKCEGRRQEDAALSTADEGAAAAGLWSYPESLCLTFVG